MPFHITDDPERDFLDHERMEREIAKTYPKCACCDEPIIQEFAVNIGRLWFCDDCLDDHRKETISDD